MKFEFEEKKTNTQNYFKFALIFLFLIYAITFFPYYYPFPQITSFAVAGILNLIGIYALNYGHFLIVENLPNLEVSAECSGVVLFMIFPLTIFLMPNEHIQFKHRIASLLFIPVLFLGNIIRLVIDVLIGLNISTDALILFHDSLGQVFIFFWAIAMYVLWLIIFNNFPIEKIAHIDD